MIKTPWPVSMTKRVYYCSRARACWSGEINSPYIETHCPQCGQDSLREGRRPIRAMRRGARR
jgi:hypothetical protein